MPWAEAGAGAVAEGRGDMGIRPARVVCAWKQALPQIWGPRPVNPALILILTQYEPQNHLDWFWMSWGYFYRMFF